MTTSTSPDARSLSHRLIAVGHALHHRLFTQLREGDLHPKTALILSVIDGRVDAPWAHDRISRGGTLLAEPAERGLIEKVDDAWHLTERGRAALEKMDADRAALLADVPADEIARLTAALDVVADALGIDDADTAFERGLRSGPGRSGLRPGFGPGMHGAGPGMRDFAHRPDRAHGEHGHREHGHRSGRGEHRAPRGAQRAFERGFDAGFSRGRESSASA